MKIELTGADNARDFRGISIQREDGVFKISSKRFIRSNKLSELTDEDIRVLIKDYDLRKVIDLRTNAEKNGKPDRAIPGVEYVHIPLVQESTIGITHETNTDMQAAGLVAIPDMKELYKKLVLDDYTTLQLGKVFREILSQKEGAILWHCTEGKDRCGIVSALFLLLLGASPKEVLEDYLRTNDVAASRAQKYYEEIMKRTGDETIANSVKHAFMANEEFIRAAFDSIEETFGDVVSYAREKLGLTERDMEQLRLSVRGEWEFSAQHNVSDRLHRQMEFCLELDKEKFIGRQTYLSDGKRKENDAEHAWHMAVMALLLEEHSNEPIDLLRTVSMILLHDVVEIDAGDTYAYDEEAKKTQAKREELAAQRIFGMLPIDQAEKFMSLWKEFEERKTPEAIFARTMDNLQPIMLNDATDGKAWVEHGVCVSQILKRNEITPKGSEEIWSYIEREIIGKNLEKGRIRQ